jgi:hypothetical protein
MTKDLAVNGPGGRKARRLEWTGFDAICAGNSPKLGLAPSRLDRDFSSPS